MRDRCSHLYGAGRLSYDKDAHVVNLRTALCANTQCQSCLMVRNAATGEPSRVVLVEGNDAAKYQEPPQPKTPHHHFA